MEIFSSAQVDRFLSKLILIIQKTPGCCRDTDCQQMLDALAPPGKVGGAQERYYRKKK